MTNIKFYKNAQDITTIECIGHSGYAEYGSDIVCASISTIMNMVVVGLDKVLKIKTKPDIDEESGYMRVDIPASEYAQVIARTAYESAKALQKGYKDYIKLEVIDDVI